VTTLDKRLCKLDGINVRSEMHGDDPVTAIDIHFSDVMLTSEELNHIIREPHASNVLFDDSGVGMGGRVKQPVFLHIKPLQLADKIEGCTVRITHGVEAKLMEFAGVRLSKVTLEPRVGGMTSMGVQVQSTPDLDERMSDLLALLNHNVELELDLGEFGKQQQLALEPEKPKRSRRKDKGSEEAHEPAGAVTH
jgi:hypothetical protein